MLTRNPSIPVLLRKDKRGVGSRVKKKGLVVGGTDRVLTPLRNCRELGGDEWRRMSKDLQPC